VRIVLQQELREHEPILFNGDNYSEAWHREAETRGLPNLRTSVDAFPAWTTPKAVELFTSQRVLTTEELQSRARIHIEHYIKTITIEAALMSNLGRTVILPAGFTYQKQTVHSVNSAKEFLGNALFSEQVDFAGHVSSAVTRLCAALDVLDRIRHESDGFEEDLFPRAEFCRGTVLPAMDEVRSAADALELIADDALWPLPKYREMLFLA
jgi:glutamine synthetase